MKFSDNPTMKIILITEYANDLDANYLFGEANIRGMVLNGERPIKIIIKLLGHCDPDEFNYVHELCEACLDPCEPFSHVEVRAGEFRYGK